MALTHNPSIVRDGLVLYVDAANPKSYIGSGTVLDDLSGNDLTGTLVNGVGFDAGNGGALTFVTDDKVTFANSTLLDNQNQTVLVWAKANSLAQDGFLFEKGTVNSQYSLFFYSVGGILIWRHKIGSVITDQSITASTYLNTTDYFMLTGTYDSVNKKIYVNDVERATVAETGTVATNAGGMQIGSYVTTGYPFNGNISVVAVYNRALSADEITQNFEALRGRYGI